MTTSKDQPHTAQPRHDPAPRLVRRALISVSDKTDLIPFARFLADRKVEILSTGGSAKAIAAAGIPVKEVSDHTGFPEIMDGRVKTLHPTIHGGILARRDLDHHVTAQRDHGIADIDLVVVNLYPFEATVAKGADRETCIENIDIGGPAMIRAAAKNHDFVVVVTDPADYAPVMAEMAALGGATSLGLRRRLALDAYSRTAAYDAAISAWMAEQEQQAFPSRLTLAGQRRDTLRYGENPHQAAAFYATAERRPGIATAVQLQGKELSYNNLNDTDAAYELVAEFAQPAIAIIKHANPCGVAMDDDLATAYRRAFACDTVSAFGGIIAVNRALDAATAELISQVFSEVIIAPKVSDEARAVLAKKKNLRVLEAGSLPDPMAHGLAIKTLAGGFLAQSRDNGRIDEAALKVVSKRVPSVRELADMLFAMAVAKHVKSNAIIYAKDGATVGIGAGQMSRVDSSRIAAWKAAEAAKAAGAAESWAKGSVVASDAFFPFADGLLAAAEAGATAVIQPGGSMRDEEVIAAADQAGLAMVFTGMRHFRH
ncbi:bifunctional phosphoribosylaminoimidazolecarboxamide formyltransferase/IMP cyclohydrolase [Dongia soli]|uniref:Bifunctional purine biosynthesis protein PurH n=1 Tax=Dongia soli TaxID=600628 RepID=A0ABU5E7J5_9PROT|nr:bifunctional phosphoribosylaminoimidazolecarboxamide formyltransferase/IMP cyclohydrolase [Dongia soli]MDY0881857.1 bifunctional phosphoribosylaminoimidazolecarboxamide formyltransferase/IMP cyclohydrolase [Dongia soli]